MTCELREILQKNNISEDVTILSNSGWECGATDINAIYYREKGCYEK